ncbi:MAG: 3,4-dihydroxy-2-butanone-4-phosphate synthase, partial [Planctomycetales bacterium]
MTQGYSSIEETVGAIARGQVVIVVDAEDRENEGDFICAAEKVTPEIVNFMITHGRGMLCMPLLPDVCERLKIEPLSAPNAPSLGTPLATPIDHRTAKTGITASERAKTILETVNPSSKPSDFVMPGHVHPLIAKEGGVLRRAGHTEAAVDLARLAGVHSSGV